MRDYRIGRLKGRFVVIWTDDSGRRRRYRLAADTLGAAEREARDKILTIDRPPDGPTLAQVWAAYRQEMGERRQGAKMDDAGKTVLRRLGALTAGTMTIEDSRGHIAARRAQGIKDATIRTELGCLRSALRWAARTRLIDRAPEVAMPPVPAPRDRYLSQAEAEALIAAAGEAHVRLAIILMLTTAGRIGAILELTWDRVDLDRGVVRLATNDIGPRKGRATVPINRTLAAALQTAHTAALTDYVVEWAGRPVKSIRTGFRAAVARAGIDHCTPHDLRRTAGRFMVEAGVPIEEVAQFLGHSDPAITRSTYARFSPDHLRSAATALDRFGGISVQPPKVQTPKTV